MSAPSSLLTEDQFLCSICLEVFTDPVAIPCGHNFCKACITEHWDKNAKCQCPNCKKIFNTRPELQVNTLISGMAAQFRQSAPQKASRSSNSSSSKSGSEQQVSKPGEVQCDFCTETKMKALKSCLVCLASYCETHLKPHLTMTGMKRHQLIDPVENLEGRMCTQHDKPLDLFCQTDQTCVCVLCTYSDHKAHDIVPLKDEYEGKKTELGEREAEIQKMIQQKQVKIQEFKRSVEKSKKNADKEMADGVQVFTALKESVEKSQDKFINTIKEKQRKTEKQAEGFIKELEQEISELKKTSSEMKQLSRTEDHLHLLQNFPSVNVTPPTKDWTEVSIRPPSFEGSVVRAVAQLEETLSKQTKKLFEAELKRVQQYAVNVTLDPNTVRPSLGQASQDCRCVLSEKGFTSGRFYFEFEVKTWSVWTLGVARNRRSFSKKRTVQLRPKNGYWTVCRMCQGDFSAPADPSVGLTLKSHPEKVGVFVDYEEGLVCFFDVDAAALIYSFTDCHFTDKLSPFFSPCPNDNFETHNLERCVLQ